MSLCGGPVRRAMTIATDLQLPSLPEITLRALEACHQEASYRQISDIVSADTALVARILALANSALYGPLTQVRSVDQALLRLGTRRFHTLLMTVALGQLLFELGAEEWQQLRDFWRHSLTTALTARALATLTAYPEPDEAFLLGMLHNIGELMALRARDEAARDYCLEHPADLAADLAQSWGLGPLAADALRYQQALPTELRDASHLVKILGLATRLAQSDASGVSAASQIFGLNEALTREISRRIDHEVTGVASSLGITLDERYNGDSATLKLKQTILRQAMAGQALALATPGAGPDALLAETVSSLALITGCPALCFGYRDDALVLLSGSAGELPALSVTAVPGGSVLTDALHQREPVLLRGRTATVLDRQLLSLLRAPSLLAVPVLAGQHCPGLFALGTDPAHPEATLALSRLFCQQLGTAIASAREERNRESASTGDPTLEQELALESLRRQIHEVSNPLTIIRQYLHQLHKRLDDAEARKDLDVLREELDRAGHLLMRMSQPEDASSDPGPVSINRELERLRTVLEDTMFRDGERQLVLTLCQTPTDIRASGAQLRQIVLNLVRNAAEALPSDGGAVTIETSSPVWQHGRAWVELEISDTGPGLPDAVAAHLFSPVKSTKGEGHSGLGLSIVKRLMDDMEGIIACRTGNSGTRFRLLIPAAEQNNNDD